MNFVYLIITIILCAVGCDGQMFEMYVINEDGEIEELTALEAWIILELMDRELGELMEEEMKNPKGYIYDDKGRKFSFSTRDLKHSSLFPDSWPESTTTDYHHEDDGSHKAFFHSVDAMQQHIRESFNLTE